MLYTNAICKKGIQFLALAAMGCSLFQPAEILAFEDGQTYKPVSEEEYMNSDAGWVSDDKDGIRFEFNQTQKLKANIHADEQANIFTIGKDQPEGDVVHEYTVEEDPRTVVEDTTMQPYSAICKLTMLFEDEEGDDYQFVGSGYVIGDSAILTCAHCVYDTENDLGWLKQITIEPGRSGSELPFGSYNTSDVKYIEIEDGWAKSSKEENDNAIIVLNTNIAEKTGALTLAANYEESENIHLSGYPAKYKNTRNMGTQVEHTAGNVSLDGRCLESEVYGSGGQSGSPFLNEKGEVIGTFAYDYVFENRTGGPVMDEERIAWIEKYSDLRVDDGKNSEHETTAKNKAGEDPVYRLYNPNSGEHFYTMGADERDALVRAGWKDEGIAWTSSSCRNAQAVYRLYNPNTGDHHYTIDEKEYTELGKIGWKQEGQSWKAAAENEQGDVPVYRLYNPNAAVGSHHFTESSSEKNDLVARGWKSENIAFYISE